MEERQRKILLELINNQSLKSSDLQALIQMSSRSVRNIINKINVDIQGALIISGSFGYKLEVSDPEAFISYLQDNKEDNKDSFQYIFHQLTDGGAYVKIDDLCDVLYLSRSKLKQELKAVRDYFSEYDVAILDKPHYGMYLAGEEINIRRSIAHFQDYQKETKAYGKIKDIVLMCIRDFDYQIVDDILENIIVHLYIAYSRMQNEEYAKISDAWLAETKKEKEYPLAVAIMSLIGELLKVSVSEAETAYLTIHLCSKKADHLENIYIDQEVYDIVQQMLEVLEIQTQYSFTRDLNLQLALSLHLIPLIKRIRYKTYLYNPLITEIRQKFIASYELAMQACQVINNHFDCILPEGEIAYYALHINLALEKNLINTTKKNILLVCSSGVGSAMLLKHFFQSNFVNHINKLEVCSAYQLEILDTSDFDCVFSTIPISLNLKIPVFLIKSLVDNGDIKNIQAKFDNLEQSNVLNYFPEELFYSDCYYRSKTEAIEDIIFKMGQEYPLPENFLELVLQREALAPTEFNNIIAFPHGLKPVGNQTLVSITILSKPLRWDKNEVRIIIMGSMAGTLDKQLDDFYQLVSTVIIDEKVQWQLVQNPTYEQFVKIVEAVI